MTAAFFPIPRLSTTTSFLCLIPFCLMLFECRPSQNNAFIALSDASSTLSLSYGNIDDIVTGSALLQSQPEFTDCLHGRTAFYRAQEQGLNLTYCSSSFNTAFQHFLAAAYSAGQTAYSDFESFEVSAYVLSPAATRDRIGQVRLLYCEPDCSKGLHLINSELRIISRPFHVADEVVLQRRFYDNDMSLAITDRIWLLYRLPESSRILAIGFGTAEQAEQLYQFLTVQAPAIAAGLFSNAEAEAFISGSYSGNTGGAGNEQLILSSESAAVKQTVAIGGVLYELKIFPYSSVVLRRDDPPGFKFQSAPEIQIISNGQTANISSQVYTPDISVPGRVAIRESKDESFKKSGICIWSNPCSPGDIHPGLAYRIEEKNLKEMELPICTLNDIEVHEVNPFGVLLASSSSLQTGGKFIECKVGLRCANRSLLLKQGSWTVGFPETLESGVLVLAADQSYFETSVVESSTLRRLIPSQIIIADAENSKQVDIEENAHWIYGSKDALGLRRVHSLQTANTVIHFHGMQCQGLPHDLCLTHAMSPGTIEDQTSFETPARISEILPFLENRFIELFCGNCSGQNGRIDLMIRRLSDGREDHYILPASNQSTITLTPTETCGFNAIRYSDLYIPASAAFYSVGILRSNSFYETDNWSIDSTTYAQLRQAKSSLALSNSGLFHTQTTLPDCTVQASPGAIEFGAEP